jgi:hypothetical protein
MAKNRALSSRHSRRRAIAMTGEHVRLLQQPIRRNLERKLPFSQSSGPSIAADRAQLFSPIALSY